MIRSSGSFRTNRIRAPPFLPGSRLNAHQQTVTALQQTLVVDAARATGGTSEGKEDGKNARRRETIFGPDVGEDDEPGWTKPEEGATGGVDVVKGWVEKAKKEDARLDRILSLDFGLIGVIGSSRHHYIASPCQSQTANSPVAAAVRGRFAGW